MRITYTTIKFVFIFDIIFIEKSRIATVTIIINANGVWISRTFHFGASTRWNVAVDDFTVTSVERHLVGLGYYID